MCAVHVVLVCKQRPVGVVQVPGLAWNMPGTMEEYNITDAVNRSMKCTVWGG